MRTLFLFPVLALALVCIGTAPARSDTPTISSLLGSKQVLVVGESYGRPESTQFLSEAVTEYLSGGGCLKVGLEIASDQQETLDSAMKGDIPVSQIKINDIIDSPSYRQMLADFSAQVKSGRCLKVVAIDAPASVPVSRDAWMEKAVTEMTGDSPVVLLVGNARAVRDSGTDQELLTERLVSKSVGVASAVQYWSPGKCTNRTSQYITASNETAGTYIKETVSQTSGGDVTFDPSLATDGVFIWKCEGTDVTETVNIDDRASGEKVSDKVSVKEEEYETVVRDEKAMKRIRWGIKNQYPALGMTKEEALEAMRDEPDSLERAGSLETWTYQCLDTDGYWHTCYVLTFKDDIIVKFRDLD